MKKIFCLFIVLIFFSCQSNLTDKAQDPINKIVIGERYSITSAALAEDREVFISLPLNYKRNIHSYPIIIVMDAEYLFEITNSIVKIKTSRNEMPESIVVGIPNNTGKRSDMALELTKKDGRKFFGNNGGKSKDYLEFFRKELFPFLEKNYRVNSSNTIIGMSPTFGPVLEALWYEPNLFSGYIILAAELSLKTVSNKTVAEKVLTSLQDTLHTGASIYIGKAGKDMKRRPKEEAEAFFKLKQALDSTANYRIRYKVEILENEDHYGMSITGIQHGLETIYPIDLWDIPYRDFWNSEKPANAIKSFYNNLSKQYNFEIIPLEDSFYAAQTLLGTIRRLERQGRMKELKDVLNLAITYYPNSEKLINLTSGTKQTGNNGIK
ncbi:alpha/beta hydrolase-fold protein [uncultured Croceitalea sp.]|uniref:alpha/beta hydrolase n=1 Tax=uncultured Croceitalea sp. TaxID=1798908 RepID=UPI0033055DFD